MSENALSGSPHPTPPIRAGSVGIVVLNYRKADLTLACVESLRRQTHGDIDILVIDNHSEDGSEEKLGSGLEGARFLPTDSNLGYAGGNNVGIRLFLEEGKEFIWILNNDTDVPPGTLARMVEALRAAPALGVVGANICAMEPPNATVQMGGGRLRPFLGLVRPITDRRDLPALTYLTGSCLLVRSEVFNRIGVLDDAFFHYWEDIDFSLRVRKAGWKLACIPEAIIYHHEGASLPTGSPKAAFYFSRASARFFLKHSRIGILPVLLSSTLRVGKALCKGRPAVARAILTGLWQGLSQYPAPYEQA